MGPRAIGDDEKNKPNKVRGGVGRHCSISVWVAANRFIVSSAKLTMSIPHANQ